MKIKIYQINSGRDSNRMIFQSLKTLEKFQGNSQVDSKLYDLVFEGDVACNNLESVYEMFNINHPKGYRGRSLSVSDVIELCDLTTEQERFYYCDSFGFKPILFNSILCENSIFKEGNHMDVEKIRAEYPKGTHIELINMDGEPRMYAGLKGEVTHVDDMGQIHMNWENGSSLALNTEVDSFQKVVVPEKISVLLIEPNQYPTMIEIEDSLEAMQELVGGCIEEYMPFDDEVAIVCNEEGKLTGETLNRAIYTEPETIEMSYEELKNVFRENEKAGHPAMTGYIVFSSDSFDKEYSEASRTYTVSSRNKAFMPNMGGYSIYGSSLDGSDKMVRLEQYMSTEYGGNDGWKIEKCYIKDDSKRQLIDIIAGKFFICYAPIDSEKFLSLPDDLAKKYEKQFKYPERFYKTPNGEIIAEPFKPKVKLQER